MRQPATDPPAGRTIVVIDTDPGIDDAVALALAARSPELELIAVTTIYGNAGLPETTRNARAVLDLAGRGDVPVHAGAARSLGRPPATGALRHGPSGVGYATVSPARPVTPDPGVLVRVLRAADAPVTLLTLGPLTNLAHALEQDPAVVARGVKRHLAMLGAFTERGAADRLADFNAWADPEAAVRVLRAGLPTTLVPVDVTRRFTLSAGEVSRMAQSADPVARWLADALRYSVEAHRTARGLHGCVLNDPVVAGEILAPGLLRKEERRITVDLDEGERRGHTREHAEGASVLVATSVDVAGMRSLLDRVLDT